MRAWLEIDLDIIAANYEVVARQVGSGVDIMGVVKSDAYGHGLEQVTKVLDEKKVGMLAVISLEEAEAVRRLTKRPVMIMGYLTHKEMSVAIEEGFILSLYDKDLAALYERLAARLNRQVEVHLKVETGLNRLGVSVDEAADLLVSQRLFPHVKIAAIFSHLAKPNDPVTNQAQLRLIQELILKIQGKAELLPIHLVNSAALANFSEGYFDAVRVGMAFYGGDESILPGLQPCLSVKSVVMEVKPLLAGEGVSYDHLFTATKDMTIAVIAIGYGEGYTQALSGKSAVLINGRRARTLGKICMNLTVVDVTGLNVKRGDEVVLIGEQIGEDGTKGKIALAELAKWSQLRHHEIATRLGTVLPRLYYGER